MEQSSTSSSAGHYAVSSHVSNGNLVVDNGAGVIQTQSGNHYEENLGKFKGRASHFWITYLKFTLHTFFELRRRLENHSRV